MNRRFTDVDYLAEEMIERPGDHGISIWRENPCCAKDRLRVSFNRYQLDHGWEDIEEAGVYLKAMVRVMDEYQARFAANPNDLTITTEGWPCHGCVLDGDVEEGWMVLHGETLDTLRAGLFVS